MGFEEEFDKQSQYSEEYKKFKKTELSRSHSAYESLCHVASKIIHLSIKADKREKLANAIRLVHLDIEPEEVYSFAVIATLLAAIGGAVGLFFFFSLYTVIGVGAMVTAVYFITKKIPFTMLNRWRAQASDQLVTAILYIVINLQRGSNLERSIHFTASQIGAPLSLDFMRLLWEFQVNKYSTVKEALERYTFVWKHQEDQFVDAIHLIISSTRQNKARAEATLNRATDVVLQGVQDHMTHFAHNLQGPIRALHMLGILLPVLLLVLLPLVASFMKVPGYYLFILFDLAIPLLVYMLARNILAMRPGGISYSNADVQIKSREQSKTVAVLAAIGVILLFALAGFGYFLLKEAQGADFTRYTDPTFFLSLIGVAGVGFAIIAYLWVRNHKVIKFKRRLELIENEFSSAIFQLGSRIDEGTPPELAFAKVAEETKGMEIHEFFKSVDYNMRVKGMDLKNAIFGSSGAAQFFPSPTIRAIMKLLVEGAKRSLKAAASSLLILSRYLRDTHRVFERMKDLLADTISSMKMQASFFVAIITAVVVGLSVLIIRILSSMEGVFRGGIIGSSPQNIEMGAGISTSGLQNIAQLFNASNAMAAYQFQIMVGLYLIIIVLLLSYVLSLVVYGGNAVERRQIMIGNLFKSLIIYIVGVIIVHMVLSGITAGIIEGMNV